MYKALYLVGQKNSVLDIVVQYFIGYSHYHPLNRNGNHSGLWKKVKLVVVIDKG